MAADKKNTSLRPLILSRAGSQTLKAWARVSHQKELQVGGPDHAQPHCAQPLGTKRGGAHEIGQNWRHGGRSAQAADPGLGQQAGNAEEDHQCD